MKRLNPSTNEPFKFGETREDGFRFWGYRADIKKDENGFYKEKWLSEDRFNIQQDKNSFWKKSNKLKISQTGKIWAENNREKKSTTNKIWYSKNKEKRLVQCKDWSSKNLDKKNAASAKRRAFKLKATPDWLTKDQLLEMREFYEMAKELEKIFPWKQEVDHIEPLQGADVCGLHVPWNLQIVPMAVNRSKGINRGI